MEKIKNQIFKLWMFICMLLVFISIIYIFIYIFNYGFRHINLDFITKSPKGIPIGSKGGIYPAIVGSFYLTIISSVFASIFGISTAIYLEYYNKNKVIENIIQLTIQCIAGVPSIILGLFGYSFLVMWVGFGRSLISGGITLGIMIFPYIEVRVLKLFREIDKGYLNSSYALGVSKSYMILKIIAPIIRKDLIATICMASGFAMGATAPIILTVAVISAPVPISIFDSAMALPFHLYILISEGISIEKAYATATVLLIILFFINCIAILIDIREKRSR